jgi:hypothetical protein
VHGLALEAQDGMINFLRELPALKMSSAATHKFTTSSRNAFGETLAGMTADPNASRVIPDTSPSQLPVTGQISAGAPVGLSVLVPPTPAATQSIIQTPPVTAHYYAASAADDAYWSQQPAAVQQLREMSSEHQRQQLAGQLAAEGYSIDVPVMVWGWDAGITTQLRASAGYTWVPSALQQNVSEAPGLNNPGMTAYNASNPPAGSILVG